MTHSRPPVRLGIAGCGNVLGAYLALAAQLRHQGHADVTALCGRDRQRASALAGWPTATDLDQAGELLKTARDFQRLLICAPFTVLSPTFQTIGRRLRHGDIGRVVSAHRVHDRTRGHASEI